MKGIRRKTISLFTCVLLVCPIGEEICIASTTYMKYIKGNTMQSIYKLPGELPATSAHLGLIQRKD